jgi:hypothetical protein
MKTIKILPSRICKNKILFKNNIYIILGEVRVNKKVKLTIEDQTTILLVNGIFEKSCIKRSALIFNQGSKLKAERVYFKAADQNFKPVNHANNGGIWFIGNYADASKDGIHVKSNRKKPLSRFSADLIATHYLGCSDQFETHQPNVDGNLNDEVDGLSVLGVGPSEWSIKAIKSHHSADDGIDFTNSHVRIMHLEVISPIEDGINISSSRVEILKSLKVEVIKSSVKDRDLIDLETDDGASYLELHRGCRVNLLGVFGDEVVLSSKEMPAPITKTNNEKVYSFSGKLTQAALIYSIDED